MASGRIRFQVFPGDEFFEAEREDSILRASDAVEDFFYLLAAAAAQLQLSAAVENQRTFAAAHFRNDIERSWLRLKLSSEKVQPSASLLLFQFSCFQSVNCLAACFTSKTLLV